MFRTCRFSFLVGVMVALSSPVFAQVIDGIHFSTIPPSQQYEALAIVTDIEHIPPAIIDMTKPFREAMNRLYPELARQAKVVGANTVVITNFAFFPGGQRDLYLQVYGTAIRTRPGSTASAQSSNPAPASSQGVSAPGASSAASAAAEEPSDLSGTWSGAVFEEGDDEPIKVTVNLTAGESPGKYSGGVQVPGRKCDMLIDYYGNDGSTVIFNTDQEKGMRCMFWRGQTATPTSDGKLEWKVYTTKAEKPKYSGTLSR